MSSRNVVASDVAKTVKAFANEDVIDNIEFISTARSNSTDLIMDVSNIIDTNYVEVSDKSDDVYINESELLKLALMEIKKLKEEVGILKKKVGM